MDNSEISDVLEKVARQYPPDMVAEQLGDIPRIAFNIEMAIRSIAPQDYREACICDLGGGVGMFSVGCAAVGFKKVTLVDDFNDAVNQRVGGSVLELHRRHGVQIVSADVTAAGFDAAFFRGCDIVTTFESIEHWHNSPKGLFAQVVASLRPGGAFILSAPNCVNLRKRLTVPLGRGKWSGMREWYECPVFRGHVREPDVADVKYMACDMGLVSLRIIGRNWAGYRSSKTAIRLATKVADPILRTRPSLCSDIYMVGHKPG